jgi:hypothetical protein
MRLTVVCEALSRPDHHMILPSPLFVALGIPEILEMEHLWS